MKQKPLEEKTEESSRYKSTILSAVSVWEPDRRPCRLGLGCGSKDSMAVEFLLVVEVELDFLMRSMGNEDNRPRLTPGFY